MAREILFELGKMITDRLPQKFGIKKITENDPEYIILDRACSNDEIAEIMEGVAEIEREHEKRYLKLAQNIQDETVFAKDDVVIWQCQNCGHIYVGKEAPEVCPVCNHPQAHFQVKPENY